MVVEAAVERGEASVIVNKTPQRGGEGRCGERRSIGMEETGWPVC